MSEEQKTKEPLSDVARSSIEADAYLRAARVELRDMVREWDSTRKIERLATAQALLEQAKVRLQHVAAKATDEMPF